MRTCPYCGSQTSDDLSFCTHCGAMLGNQNVPGQSTGQNTAASAQSYSLRAGVRRNKSDLITVIVITVIVLIAAFAGVSILSNLIENGSQPSSDTGHTMNYTWDYYYDGTNYVSYGYTLTVPNSYYDKMKTTTIERTGTTSDVHLSTTQGTVFAVSEYIVVDEYIIKVSNDLRKMYDDDKASSRIPSTADFASFVMAFVQGSIVYQHDDDYTNGKYTDYWKYPLETLCDMKGDCEDTSILVAALLDASSTTVPPYEKYNAGIFLIPGHAMGAVKVTDISSSASTDDNVRFGYYPIETAVDGTNVKNYKIGTIASDYENDYFHLYTGYSTSYYGVTSS